MKKMYINRNSRRLYTGRRGMYSKRNTSALVVFMLIAIILLIAAATYSVMNTIRNNKKYDEYMISGNEYYTHGEYMQALTSFSYAEKYCPNNSEAKIGKLNSYVNIDLDEAVDYAREVVKSGVNEELFLQMAQIVNKFDSGSAYEMLEDYVADKKSIGEEVQQLVDLANGEPVKPVLNILPGTYVKLTNVEFSSGDTFGNSIYYTLNEEVPNQYSKEYRGGFEITQTSDVRVRSFNAKGEGSDTALYSFIIDASMGNQLLELVESAKALINSVSVGVEEGQCSQKNVDKLNEMIDEAQALMNKDNVLFMDAENYVEYIQEAMTEFKNSINKNIAKNDVSDLVKFGTQVYNTVNKSGIANDLTAELEELNVSLEEATNVYNDNGTQSQLNKAYYTLYEKLYNVNAGGWKSAYKKLIVENGANYLIYDINFDDIPELILQQENVTMFYAYSVSLGEAVNINMDNNKYDLFFAHRKGLLSCKGSSEEGDFRLMTYKDNKITLSDLMKEYNENITLRTSLEPLVFKAYNEDIE